MILMPLYHVSAFILKQNKDKIKWKNTYYTTVIVCHNMQLPDP